MGNLLVGIIILTLLGLAVWKIRKDKKQGKACTGCSGCPIEGQCSTVK